MRKLLFMSAVAALLTGSAWAQDNSGSNADPNAATGSSNAAVNGKGNAPSNVNASGTATMVAPSALEKGANSFTEGQARSRLEGAGLASVTGLHKDDQGIWRGKAMRDGKQVDVGFDYKGNIGVQ
jgi:periplasmic protein CpxP/Spy